MNTDDIDGVEWKKWAVFALLMTCVVSLVAMECYWKDREAAHCLRCEFTVVPAPASRCPEGPVMWRDLFKSPKRGGFTVTVPEGSWRMDWRQIKWGSTSRPTKDECAPCSPTLICSACFADTDPCQVCRDLKE